MDRAQEHVSCDQRRRRRRNGSGVSLKNRVKLKWRWNNEAYAMNWATAVA